MGRIVCNNAYRTSPRHAFSTYTILFGTPLIFCTPNIADNRYLIIWTTPGEELNLYIDAAMELQIFYAQFRLRVASDPV